MRARFDNADARLLPGMYVTARLDFGDVPGILVPQKAVIRDESGQARIWIVDKDNTVHRRSIDTVRAVDDKWLVTAGVSAGDRVVTEGMHRLQESAPVTPHPEG
ncbi:MAG: HlyD family secretion protein [Gammaproteobacteria bacterium]|nr:HlyD family secretion protein [Gammaproteobacteria bacterium]